MSTLQNIWLIMTGEPLPFHDDRPHRVGILARMLADKGHDVTWWASTVDHQNKSFYYRRDETIELRENLKLILLHGHVLYKKNVSFIRILNHILVARKFRSLSNKAEKPDIIFCCFPTIDLSYAAVKYGEENDVPVIIDVRDLWPDIFLEQIPFSLKVPARLFLSRYFKMTKNIFRKCFSITAVSEKYLTWALKYGAKEQSRYDAVFPLSYENTDPNKNGFKGEEYLKRLGIDNSKTIVWFVGTFGQAYDLDTVIEVARILNSSKDNIQFVFTGRGEQGRRWQALSAGLRNVVFTGWADKSQLACLSGVADIGLMAYKKNAPQGIPNKTFDYMSGGIPILSSLQGETAVLLNKSGIGLTYHPENRSSFTEVLVKLVDSPEIRKEMANKSKILYERSYSSKMVYGNLISFIESVCSNFANKVRKNRQL